MINKLFLFEKYSSCRRIWIMITLANIRLIFVQDKLFYADLVLIFFRLKWNEYSAIVLCLFFVYCPSVILFNRSAGITHSSIFPWEIKHK